jgi:hypothetical protein
MSGYVRLWGATHPLQLELPVLKREQRMTYRQSIAASSLLLCVAGAIQAAPPVTDLESALAKAKESDKPIFAYVFDSV